MQTLHNSSTLGPKRIPVGFLACGGRRVHVGGEGRAVLHSTARQPRVKQCRLRYCLKPPIGGSSRTGNRYGLIASSLGVGLCNFGTACLPWVSVPRAQGMAPGRKGPPFVGGVRRYLPTLEPSLKHICPPLRGYGRAAGGIKVRSLEGCSNRRFCFPMRGSFRPYPDPEG